MATTIDAAWATYIRAKAINFDEPAYLVNAAELKDITGREPRLLAKFDTPEQLPTPFRDAGYTLVPTKNGQWIIVPGSLFVKAPLCPQIYEFTPKLLFPLLTAGRGSSESQYIDAAFNTGLLATFLNLNEMYLTIRGREYTLPFDFQLGSYVVRTQSVQIEVDAGYEGLHEIVLLEAKIGKPDAFNIRQLYYPFRHFSALVETKRVRKLVRNVFLAYDISTETYHLYEYTFENFLDPNSAEARRCAIYRIAQQERLVAHDLIDAEFRTESKLVPQADDLNKVFELLTLVDAGLNRATDVAEYFVFAKRQSSYYREAAEYMGLLARTADGRYELTERGIYLLTQPPGEKARAFAKAIMNSWIFVELLRRAGTSRAFSVADIEAIIASVHDKGDQRYTASTVQRRRQTIVAWLKWLAQEFGCVIATSAGYKFQ